MRKIACTVIVLLLVATCDKGAKEKPSWIYDPPKDFRLIYAVGLADRDTTLAVARQKALDNALFTLALQIETRVSGMIRKYGEATGDTMNADSTFIEFKATKRVVTKEVVDLTLKDLRIEEEYFDQDGYWILVSLSLEEVQEARNRSLYTKFRASQVFKEFERILEEYEASEKKQDAP